MRRFIVVVLLFLCTLFNASLKAENIKVVFLNPGHPAGDDTGCFWSNVNRFMEAAADDLDIELITLFAQRDHILMKQMAKEVAQYQPDYAIVVNEKGAGVSIVRELAADNIPVLMLLNNFTNTELESLSPHQRKKILGSLIPDNFLVGQRLMADLFAVHKERQQGAQQTTQTNNKTERYKVLALQGDYRSAAALERKRGLEAFVNEEPSLFLIDTPVAHWSREEAYRKVKGILRYDEIDILWAANDPMAIGAKQALLEAGQERDVTVGGINWDRRESAIDIDVSYGGHVTLGAKALVMLHDYHHQAISRCEMTVKIDIFVNNERDQFTQFQANTSEGALDKIDFKRFSKLADKPEIFDIHSITSKDLSYHKKVQHAQNEWNTCLVKQ